MEPTMYRGDLVINQGWTSNYKIGDIVIWQLGTSPRVIHRIIQINGSRFLTKGDHNNANDQGLYQKYGHPHPEAWLSLNEIKSRVLLHFPKGGFPLIFAKEYPVISIIIVLGIQFLWVILWKKQQMDISEMAYTLISTLAVLFVAKFISS
ncbi:MAG: hypothetical protein EZS28_008789 [Streblomastix strix]|uniref:Signal peptidase complex catalytic subunit SEC11 n=1 Tax=Streblomastix strix TaxID=222440 RepID=A0A5J4WM42_9EUKA|nr:MAG: hypothetical protein EZS28_008789 [Streblomastix strix]